MRDNAFCRKIDLGEMVRHKRDYRAVGDVDCLVFDVQAGWSIKSMGELDLDQDRAIGLHPLEDGFL